MEVAKAQFQKQQNVSPQEAINKGKGILQAGKSTNGQNFYGANKGRVNYISTGETTKATNAIAGMFPAFTKSPSIPFNPGKFHLEK